MEEKLITKKNGMLGLLVALTCYLCAGVAIFLSIQYETNDFMVGAFVVFIITSVLGSLLLAGIKAVGPQEAKVLLLFGSYHGTIKEAGLYFVNPFCITFNPASSTLLGQSGDVKSGIGLKSSKNISLKLSTLNNSKQKINDVLGNPIEIGIAVMWRVIDTGKAVFNVDNYKEYLSLQCDSAVRDIVRIYPYDVSDNIDTTGDGEPDDGSLRGSSRIVVERIKNKIQEKVNIAGIQIEDVRITYLAYAPEIAAVMLQRQQAKAIIDARKMIVEGAVGMVDMALEKLKESNSVVLDEERKATMVSNLLVVLCGNHDVQPVVNSGSLY